eukprot:15339911-Ditylum_brightwellii.AAC.1
MPRKVTISSSIVKEIQRTIVLVCLDMIYESGAMPKSRQEDMIYEFYHGMVEKDIVSKVDQFISTSHPFKKFWDNCYLVVSDDATVATPTSRSTLKTYLVPNKKTSATISDKTTFRIWQECLCNVKKAMSIAESYLNVDKSLPSGTCVEDFLLCLKRDVQNVA